MYVFDIFTNIKLRKFDDDYVVMQPHVQRYLKIGYVRTTVIG